MLTRPPPIVKLADAQHYSCLFATLLMDNPLEIALANVMKLQAILEKLNKIFVANLKRTIDSFFKTKILL